MGTNEQQMGIRREDGKKMGGLILTGQEVRCQVTAKGKELSANRQLIAQSARASIRHYCAT
jgi:hypothetical protein